MCGVDEKLGQLLTYRRREESRGTVGNVAELPDDSLSYSLVAVAEACHGGAPGRIEKLPTAVNDIAVSLATYSTEELALEITM